MVAHVLTKLAEQTDNARMFVQPAFNSTIPDESEDLMSNNSVSDPLLAPTAQIVSAHLRHNNTPANSIPLLIQQIYAALRELGSAPEPAQRQPQEPAVPIKRSVFPDYIICLEDGKQMKTLKRHLQTSYNMTTDEYRAKWGLPANYPMTAPSYTAHRSMLAKETGLGRKSLAAQPRVIETSGRERKSSAAE